MNRWGFYINYVICCYCHTHAHTQSARKEEIIQALVYESYLEEFEGEDQGARQEEEKELDNGAF